MSLDGFQRDLLRSSVTCLGNLGQPAGQFVRDVHGHRHVTILVAKTPARPGHGTCRDVTHAAAQPDRARIRHRLGTETPVPGGLYPDY